MNSENSQDRLDEATARRLGKLRSMPVDNSRLDRLIQSQIPRVEQRRFMLSNLRPFRAVAASIAALGIIGVIFWSLSGGAVLASPDTIARFHEELVNGTVPAIQVESIAAANRALAEEWKTRVEIPQVPTEHVMLCCMRTIKDKRVACVLLKGEGGVPVTMVVAEAMDMRMPTSDSVVRDGVRYHIQAAGRLNMIMAERDGRWICLIGELPSERLTTLASAIQF